MSRWQPNARGRLEQAALELYAERGFESTTVAEIAERAGLTERTFFRHFADKREVLFAGSSELQGQMVQAVSDAPESLPPIDVVAAGLEAAPAFPPPPARAPPRGGRGPSPRGGAGPRPARPAAGGGAGGGGGPAREGGGGGGEGGGETAAPGPPPPPPAARRWGGGARPAGAGGADPPA